ncbi:hypothetical protein, partial [Paraburkholderia aspalathi]|uniref:hypothetical protein n=1 Tax=Paraburkholderia aspalathi TaxID=1324617 RepID=UPI0038BD93C7
MHQLAAAHPASIALPLSSCGAKTAFLHDLRFPHKAVNYYIFMLAILDSRAKFYAPNLPQINSNQVV